MSEIPQETRKSSISAKEETPCLMISCLEQKRIFKNRIKTFFPLLENGIAILLAGPQPSRTANIDARFHSQSNFFYFTGLEQPGTIAVLRNVRSQQHYSIFWQEADEKERVWNGPRMSKEEVKRFTGANVVYPLDMFAAKLPEYLEGAKNLFYTFNIDPIIDKTVLDTRQRLLKQNFTPTVAPMCILELEKTMEELRICKDAYEIACIRKAVDITAKAYREIMAKTRAGMYEYEIEAMTDCTYRRYGGYPSFPTIVASGANATVLHYTRNEARLSNKDMVLVDSGAEYKHYCADVTRTWPVGGKFTPAQKDVYSAVLDVQKKAISCIKPGEKIEEFHTQTVQGLVEKMMDLKILSGRKNRLIAEKTYQKFYMHRTGHHLGLDVHDVGGYYFEDTPRIFKPGMVITVEPGIYIHPDTKDVPSPFKGIGVRIEDDVLVTETGCEVLTSAIPKEVEEVEDVTR